MLLLEVLAAREHITMHESKEEVFGQSVDLFYFCVVLGVALDVKSVHERHGGLQKDFNEKETHGSKVSNVCGAPTEQEKLLLGMPRARNGVNLEGAESRKTMKGRELKKIAELVG